MTDIRYASWVHGHSMQIQTPEDMEIISRERDCIRIRGKPGLPGRPVKNVLHFAIPTPVIIDDNRTRVDSVMLVCRTTSIYAVVTDIYVYDGAKEIGAFLRIDRSEDIGFERWEIPTHEEISGGNTYHWKPETFYGIGISIYVEFIGGSSSEEREMVFEAAGCDFRP